MEHRPRTITGKRPTAAALQREREYMDWLWRSHDILQTKSAVPMTRMLPSWWSGVDVVNTSALSNARSSARSSDTHVDSSARRSVMSSSSGLQSVCRVSS